MAAPRSSPARSLWPWVVLAAIYTIGAALAFAGGGADGGSFTSLEGVMALFRFPLVAFVGWVHYLCFDLFVGRWIMNDAPEGGYRLLPVLFLTLMVGPAGWLLDICFRGFFRGA